jgi:hypothetical protein
LSVAPKIHVNEIRSAIAEDLRGMGFAPPKAVVLQFCKIACGCRISGEEIFAHDQPSPEDVLSSQELIVYSVLREAGPLLHRTELERRCAKKGMNPYTFANYIYRLSILAKYGRGIYGLRGANVGPGDVERCVPTVKKRQHDHGWTQTAMPWLAVELSAANLSSGTITIPSGVQRFVQGRFLLRLRDGTEAGNFVISHQSGWGLRSLFNRTAGEPGDAAVFTFDLQRHEVVVEFGTMETIIAKLDDSQEDPVPRT